MPFLAAKLHSSVLGSLYLIYQPVYDIFLSADLLNEDFEASAHFIRFKDISVFFCPPLPLRGFKMCEESAVKTAKRYICLH